MNKYDLVKRLRKNCGLTEAEVEKLIKAKIDTFAEALAEGERGFLPGFRTFVLWHGPPEEDATQRQVRHSPFPPITQSSSRRRSGLETLCSGKTQPIRQQQRRVDSLLCCCRFCNRITPAPKILPDTSQVISFFLLVFMPLITKKSETL